VNFHVFALLLGTPVFVARSATISVPAAPASGPVKKGNLMLAKKKDHSKAAEKPAKKSEKKSKK